jgi:hypothetical protein
VHFIYTKEQMEKLKAQKSDGHAGGRRPPHSPHLLKQTDLAPADVAAAATAAAAPSRP